jgi:hypothetical protein
MMPTTAVSKRRVVFTLSPFLSVTGSIPAHKHGSLTPR